MSEIANSQSSTSQPAEARASGLDETATAFWPFDGLLTKDSNSRHLTSELDSFRFKDTNGDGFITDDDNNETKLDPIEPKKLGEGIAKEGASIVILGEVHDNVISNAQYLSESANAISDGGTNDVVIAIEEQRLGTVEGKTIFDDLNNGEIERDEFKDRFISEFSITFIETGELNVPAEDAATIRERVDASPPGKRVETLEGILADEYGISQGDISGVVGSSQIQALTYLTYHDSGHKVVPVDINPRIPGKAEALGVSGEVNRDAFMAETVADIKEQNPDATILVSVGAYHAREFNISPSEEQKAKLEKNFSDYENPLGKRLADQFGGENVLSINLDSLYSGFLGDPSQADPLGDTFDATIPSVIDEYLKN